MTEPRSFPALNAAGMRHGVYKERKGKGREWNRARNGLRGSQPARVTRGEARMVRG